MGSIRNDSAAALKASFDNVADIDEMKLKVNELLLLFEAKEKGTNEYSYIANF